MIWPYDNMIQFINDFSTMAEEYKDAYAIKTASRIRQRILLSAMAKEEIENGYQALIGFRIVKSEVR